MCRAGTIGLSVDADISEATDLFGKTVSDLQENVALGTDAISGTLKFVEDYTSAGYDMSLGNHFIALHAESNDGAVITCQVSGGSEVTLDEDGIVICQLADNTKTITLKATKDGETVTKTFSVSEMTFAEE